MVGVFYSLRRKAQCIACDIIPHTLLSRLYSKAVIGYQSNLTNPKTFNEKIQWYKLFYCPKKDLISKCADKYAVREYLENKGYGEYLNDIFGVWDSEDAIPWDRMPNQYVLKCTHGCAYNIICPDRKSVEVEKAKKKLHKWMKEDFGKFNLELHYSKIRPRIICEKFLGGNMTDYKFFCFNGRVEFMYISEGLDHDDTATIAFFNRNRSPAAFHRDDYAVNVNAVVPPQFDKILKLSEELAVDFPFVRVDWFVVNEKIYFSEFTFAPCAGMMQFNPKEYDLKTGELFDLTPLMSSN